MKKFICLLIILQLISNFTPSLALPSSIKVAAIFDREGDEKHALAFTAAIDYVNDIDNWRLPGIILEPVVIKIPYGDRYVFAIKDVYRSEITRTFKSCLKLILI